MPPSNTLIHAWHAHEMGAVFLRKPYRNGRRRVGYQLKACENALRIELGGNKIEGQIGGGQTAKNEEEDLNNIGVANYLHASQRDDDGKGGKKHHAKREAKPGNGAYCQCAREIECW
jgi:hypothetical protein